MSDHLVLALCVIATGSFILSYVGAAVGLVLGQLRVALLCYVLGSPAVGTATSLAISTIATIVGSAAHLRGGRVDVRLLFTVGLPSALAAYASARFAAWVDARMLKALIAGALLFTGVEMLRQSLRMARDPRHSLAPTGQGPFVVLGQVLLGVVLGGISGVVGLLLGSLRLPAMVRLAQVPPARAVGTNMAIGAITGVSAGLSALTGDTLHLPAFAIVCPLTMLGAHFGAHQAGKLNERALVRWIAAVIIPTAIGMLVEASYGR